MNKEALKFLNELRVLIIEDDEFLGLSLIGALEPYCRAVRLEKDGQSGLEAYFEGSFDVTITDINLPQKSGLAVAKEIRNIDENAPVIIITAHDSERNIKSAIDARVFAFLHKPFEIEQLYNELLMSISQISRNSAFIALGRGFEYDQKNKILLKDGAKIHLTKTEAALLYILVKNIGELTPGELIERFAWRDKAATADTIRSYINKLRSKTYYELIENVQGYGYKLKAEI